MKNDIEEAKQFLYYKGEPEWYVESKDVANYLVAYHNYLMAEIEKEVSDKEIEKEAMWRFTNGHGATDWEKVADFKDWTKWMRSKIFPK